MSDCRFGVSPVNYPDPDPDPCVEIFWCRNVLVPKRLGVFRDLVPNRLDTETSGAPGLGRKSLITKMT